MLFRKAKDQLLIGNKVSRGKDAPIYSYDLNSHSLQVESIEKNETFKLPLYVLIDFSQSDWEVVPDDQT